MKEIISTDQAPAAIGPYSQAIKAGNMLFASGQIPLKSDGTMVTGGIAEQTRQVLENLTSVLKAAGLELKDVVKTTVFLSDMNNFAEMNKVYESFFGETKPARATVEVARLPKDVLVEIDCIAVE